MKIFAEEEKKHKVDLQHLTVRLSKFISKRNVSFNTKMVFLRWKAETDHLGNISASALRTIGNMRKFVREKTNEANPDAQQDAGPTTADSEGRDTNEAQETNQNE